MVPCVAEIGFYDGEGRGVWLLDGVLRFVCSFK